MNKRVLSLVYDITFSFSCLSLASFTQLSSLAYSFISDLEMFVSFKALFLSLFSWQAMFLLQEVLFMLMALSMFCMIELLQ